MSLHQSIANDVTRGKLATITCHTCGRKQDVTSKQFGQYLALGWPKCHGQTMELRLQDKP